ncbi:MAG: thioredoxin family protein [Proteobacteria bacterium]|nr:thioredoxin family protein [Pseudomonadota bacterium]
MAFIGKPVQEEKTRDVLEIKVLGQGCPRCDQLEHDVIKIASEMNIIADIEHVRDINEIAQYGVMGSPALVINGTVKAVGNIPPRQKIMDWLALANDNKK